MNGKSLGNLLKKQQITVPAVYDCISARAVELSGYQAAYLNSCALAGSCCGVAAMGMVTADEVSHVASRIAEYSPLSVIVDFENGFSDNILSVCRSLRKLLHAGADAVILDDTTNIRSVDGHIETEIISQEQWNQKVKAVSDIASEAGCLVICRTFAKGISGLKEAINRCVVAESAGADLTSIYGLKTMEEANCVAASVKGWKMWSDLGVTDRKQDVDAQQIEKLGYRLITIHYTEKGTLFGMADFANHTKQNGNTVYHDEHDFNGLLQSRDYHTLFDFHKYWLPLEERLNNVDDICNIHIAGKKAGK